MKTFFIFLCAFHFLSLNFAHAEADNFLGLTVRIRSLPTRGKIIMRGREFASDALAQTLYSSCKLTDYRSSDERMVATPGYTRVPLNLRSNLTVIAQHYVDSKLFLNLASVDPETKEVSAADLLCDMAVWDDFTVNDLNLVGRGPSRSKWGNNNPPPGIFEFTTIRKSPEETQQLVHDLAEFGGYYIYVGT